MRAIRVVMAAVPLAALLALPVMAQEEVFQDGNRLYQEERYAEALEAWLRVREAGYESGALWFNLGNAYFKTGDLGRAILSWERARTFSPGEADVLENLELARSLTADDIEPLPEFWLLSAVRWWVDLLPLGLLRLSVGAAWLAAGVGAVGLVLARGGGTRRVAGATLWVAGGVAVLLGANLLVRELGIGTPERAVVLTAEASVQSAPSPDSNLTLFNIHEGTVLRVERRSDDWAEVVLVDGRVGWIRSEVFETI